MNMTRSRVGSALLVVLGMLSFMLISGLAFSVYMRATRLPSSFLRRTSASRQLVKAALAEAIQQVEYAVGNDPHPGIRNNKGQNNVWTYGVLVGTNLLSAADTVATLTLEGLAYVPPARITEIRKYSRQTPTARWQRLGYDVGRYAFTAIDVSDCFDVNRMFAGFQRASSSGRKVSLAYAFEDEDHSSAPSGAENWDSFMDAYREVDSETDAISYGSKVPFVSLADFNLALGAAGGGGLVSPWCKGVTGNGRGGFYTNLSGDDLNRARYMHFVTDSWNPRTVEEKENEILDSDAAVNQPFTGPFLEQVNPALQNVLAPSGQTEPINRLLGGIPRLGLVALYDYLDPDRVPASLAVPTTERVAMVTGVRFNHAAALDFQIVKYVNGKKEEEKVPDDIKNNGDNTRTKTRIVDYRIDSEKLAKGLASIELETLLAYPFRQTASESVSFTVDARLAFFLATRGENRFGRRTSQQSIVRFGRDADLAETRIDDNAVISIPLDAQQVSFGKVVSEEDALQKKSFRSGPQKTSKVLTSILSVLSVTYQWVEKQNKDGQWIEREPTPEDIIAAGSTLKPLDASGVVDSRFANDATLLSNVKKGDFSVEAGFREVFWVRVKYNDPVAGEQVVDLVPACIKDDDEVRTGSKNWTGGAASMYQQIGGVPYPNMYLHADDISFAVSLSELEKQPSGQIAQGAVNLLVADPRYNHAPENWFEVAAGDIAETWKQSNHAKDNARDGDIWMETSDQGYLQSIYELAFLPRLSNSGLDAVGASSFYGDYPSFASGDWNNNDIKNFEDTKDREFMWKTYCPFADGPFSDDFDSLGFDSLGSGPRVCPYTPYTNVMMAAFANTPANWRMASTNVVEGAASPAIEMSLSEFNGKYAWNGYSSGVTKMEWEDLEDICGRFMDRVRGENGDWRAAWDDLDWGRRGTDADEYLCGIELEAASSPEGKVHSVDRKFLYGYWRDCFASRQQLFLIFVRAEPIMMGGVVADNAPPQLGARAVALVWRDPTTTAADNALDPGNREYHPHRTRILFYRNLE